MADAIFKFTDPDKSPFVVRPLGTNGPLSPTSVAPLHPQAVSANTPFVIVGKGVVNYGELIQSNTLYLLENFANATAPVFAVEGMLWFNNDTTELSLYGQSTWSKILVDGVSSSAFDMNGQSIINLGNPTNPQDATTKFYTDGKFVALAGSTMTGFLTLSANPTSNLHASTKQYVDSEIAAAVLASGGDGTAYTDAQVALKVSKSGDTMTGDLNLTNSANLIVTPGSSVQLTDSSIVLFGTSFIDAGTTRITNVGTPISDDDAATKLYVDEAVVSIVDGTIDPETGVITLETSTGFLELSNMPVAPFYHTHDSSDITYDYLTSASPESSLVNTIAISQMPLDETLSVNEAVNSLAGDMANLSNKTDRHIQLGNSTTSITLPFPYPVEKNKLQIFKNGIKQYMTPRAEGTIQPASYIRPMDFSSITYGTYYYNLTIDGVLHENIPVDFTEIPIGEYINPTIIPVNPTVYATYADVLNALTKQLGTRAYQTIKFTAPITESDPSGLLAGNIYSAIITMDGVPSEIFINGDFGTTYEAVFNSIRNFLRTAEFELVGDEATVYSYAYNSESTISIVDNPGVGVLSLFSSLTNFSTFEAAVPGTAFAYSHIHGGKIVIYSPTTGLSSAVTIDPPTAGSNFLTALGATATDGTVAVVYDYAETGIPLRNSTSVTFTASTINTDIYEFIVHPSGLQATANGTYP